MMTKYGNSFVEGFPHRLREHALDLLAGLHTQSDPRPYVRTLIILAFVCFLMATTVLDVWVTDVSVTGYKKDTGRRRAWVSSPVLLYTLSCARRVEATPSYGCALAFVHACQWHQRPWCQSGNSKASTLSSAKKKVPIRSARKHTRHICNVLLWLHVCKDRLTMLLCGTPHVKWYMKSAYSMYAGDIDVL